MSDEKPAYFNFELNETVLLEFTGSTFAEYLNKNSEYDAAPKYLYEVNINGEPRRVSLTKVLTQILIDRGGNGPGNQYEVTAIRKDGKRTWSVEAKQTNGTNATCNYTNVEDRNPADVNSDFGLTAAAPAEASTGNGKGYNQSGLPGTLEGDVAILVEAFYKAKCVYAHPETLAILEEMDLGTPMLDNIQALAIHFSIAAQQRGERNASHERFGFERLREALAEAA